MNHFLLNTMKYCDGDILALKKVCFNLVLQNYWDGDNFRTQGNNKHLEHMYLPEKHFHFKRLTVTFLGFTEHVCTESTVKRCSK